MPRRLAAFALSLLALACAPTDESPDDLPAPARPAASTAAPPGVAVVELFTSEGCSSCPPADAVLGEFAREAEASGRRVVALAFHVDYWDRLGWRDPFGQAAHTARQWAYARAADATRVYTPQMLVNGTAAFVGSRRAEARRHVAEALDRPSPAAVALEATGEGNGALGVRYTVAGAPAGAVLHLALVQREASQAVRRGENRGRTLQHAHVVRGFRTVPAATGATMLVLPDGVAPRDVLVAAYVQQGDVGMVLGAALEAVSPGRDLE